MYIIYQKLEIEHKTESSALLPLVYSEFKIFSNLYIKFPWNSFENLQRIFDYN